jgi:hypothetical protein
MLIPLIENMPELVPVPEGIVTAIGPDTMVEVFTVAVIEVAEFTVKLSEGILTPPILTPVAPVKYRPVISIVVVEFGQPLVGLKLVIVGSGLFRRTDTLLLPLLAVTRSGFPSLSKSPIATDFGEEPELKSTLGAKEFVLILPLEEVFLKTEIVFDVEFATAISVFPSPSMSANLTEAGALPAVKSTFAAKELKFIIPLAPVLRRIEIELLRLLAAAISGFPSPSKSPAATEIVLKPVVKLTPGANELDVMLPFSD